jgi:hypothetical protein
LSKKQVRVLSLIEAKGHLVKVGWKMLGADLAPRSNYAALHPLIILRNEFPNT